MNKKTILGLLTGAAIVAATTGSYAAWDQLEATGVATVKLRQPVIVSNTLTGSLSDSGDLGTPSYSAEFTVKAGNLPTGTTGEWTLTPEIKKADDTPVTNEFDITISDTVNNKADVQDTINGDKFTVTVTPKEGAADLAGTDLKVDVTAALSAKTTPAVE